MVLQKKRPNKTVLQNLKNLTFRIFEVKKSDAQAGRVNTVHILQTIRKRKLSDFVWKDP
jgi:hypothetical protein